MINIDTRILKGLDANEVFFLLHLIKYINAAKTCFPSNTKLCEDMDWDIKRLQKTKNSLLKKGLLEITERKNAGGLLTSNLYRVKTALIGIYIAAEDVAPGEEPIAPKQDGPPTLFRDIPPTPKADKEVLANEVLTNEQLAILVIGSLNRIKRQFGIRGKSELTKARKAMIEARIKESKATLDEIERMIEHRCKVWKNTDFEKYIRPDTLFRSKNFINYMEELQTLPEEDWTKSKSSSAIDTSDNYKGRVW